MKEETKKWYLSLSDEQKTDYTLYYIEALASLFNMVKTSYDKLQAFRNKASADSTLVVQEYPVALAEAWMFIDSYALFSKTIYFGHLAIKNTERFKEFNDFSEPIRDCRNYHYHLEAENQYLKSGNSQVFGNLTWASDDGECFVVSPSCSLRGKPSVGLALDTKYNRYNSKLSLFVNNRVIDFDYYFERLVQIKDEIVASFNEEAITNLFDNLQYVVIKTKYTLE